ncbi:MAG: hypothetical protein ACO3JL_06190 [Myxococcota bacterium]
MKKLRAFLVSGGFVIALSGCGMRECVFDGECGLGDTCSVDGQCRAADGIGAERIPAGIYAEGLNVTRAALRGDIGNASGLSGPAHRVEVYQWTRGTDVLIYSEDATAFSFLYLNEPLSSLPVGETTFPAGRSVDGTAVNGQLCITGGAYDVPASEVVVTVTEADDGSREYRFEVETSRDDWATAELATAPTPVLDG